MSGLYSALHDFQCNQQHCLSFKKDQIVEVRVSVADLLQDLGRFDHTFNFTHIEQVKRIVVPQRVVIPRYKFRSPSLAYIVLLYKSNSVDIVLNWKL